MNLSSDLFLHDTDVFALREPYGDTAPGSAVLECWNADRTKMLMVHLAPQALVSLRGALNGEIAPKYVALDEMLAAKVTVPA